MFEQGACLQSTVHSKNFALLGHYTASSGNFLPMFLDNLSVPSPLKTGQISFPETSVRNYHYLLCNDPEGRSSDLLCGGSLASHTVHSGCQLELLLPELQNGIWAKNYILCLSCS